MDQQAFDAWTRRRFAAAAGGLSALIGLGLSESGTAKKRKKKKPKNLCRPDGASCRKKGKQCQNRFCLQAPFTIEATWTSAFSHDAYLTVPKENASTRPGPYLNFACNEGNSNCEAKYPFACISEEQTAPGDGVTTVYKLLPGAYEYWVQIHADTERELVTIVLRDKGGRVVREWTNPDVSGSERGWHVFDIDGQRGSFRSIDELADQSLPKAAVDPFTFVCGI